VFLTRPLQGERRSAFRINRRHLIVEIISENIARAAVALDPKAMSNVKIRPFFFLL
jgi:hypothetical protein